MSFSSVLFSSMSNSAGGNCNSNIIEKTLNSKAETSIPRSTMFFNSSRTYVHHFLRLCHSFLKTIHSLLEAVTFIIFLQKHAPLVEYLMRTLTTCSHCSLFLVKRHEWRSRRPRQILPNECTFLIYRLSTNLTKETDRKINIDCS